MRKKLLIVLFVSLFLVSILFFGVVDRDSGGGAKLFIKNSRGKDVRVDLYIAENHWERKEGLSGRESLDKDKGMLFIFDNSGIRSFTMRDTHFPLSIAYIDSEGTILEIQKMVPGSRKIYTPQVPFLYALEVNQGFFENHNIEAENEVSFRNV